ncbi:MAG TPA: hypothetical protein PKC09_00445 [Paracoccus sp. (in: a-proteobacteria)]|uniref:hypothetical protein n=1 Tax=uncultured Paracoccus sp. TaxID=189685 RepID=UPI0026288D69|nr:hypothetical protein [uncultured Paracoccus sp.]HMQ39713.1 hypothetical protein [Paracoccus sp. (in: a-proteobacteria)]
MIMLLLWPIVLSDHSPFCCMFEGEDATETLRPSLTHGIDLAGGYRAIFEHRDSTRTKAADAGLTGTAMLKD